MKAYKGWIVLLILLLALGVGLVVYGAIEHQRAFRLPHAQESAIHHCAAPRNLS